MQGLTDRIEGEMLSILASINCIFRFRRSFEKSAINQIAKLGRLDVSIIEAQTVSVKMDCWRDSPDNNFE